MLPSTVQSQTFIGLLGTLQAISHYAIIVRDRGE